MQTGIEIPQLPVVKRALKELGADRKALQEPGIKAANILIAAARPLVPVRTGRLQGALKAGKVELGGRVIASKTIVPYANPIHWGWLVVSHRHQGVRKPGTYIGIKPNPFLSDALGYTKQEIYDNYVRQMTDYVEKKLETK